MRLSLLLAPLALAACSTPADNSTNVAVDDVANASAFQPMEPLDPPAPGTPGGLPDDRTPISEGSFTPDSAQGAGQVVQSYYALLEKGDFRQAWELWADHGAASGVSSADFAASFGKYSEYHANIGAPGEIDAGAGQRYVTIPVQVYGRLKEGAKPFYMIGTMTLHRTEVDGASAEQRKWRIRSTDIKPRPGDAAAGRQPGDEDNRSTARAGKRLAVLKQERVASGIAYAGGGYALRGKGDDMDFTAPDLPPLPCTAIR